MTFAPDDFVRYKPGGPRGALGGCIGVVVEPTPLCQEHGWVRVRLEARVDDYSQDELEPAHYWAYLSTAAERWQGPYKLWSDAAQASAEMLRASADFATNHPLVHKREQLISDLVGSDPVPMGIVGYHPSAGTARIVVAGAEQPSLYDKGGKKIA